MEDPEARRQWRRKYVDQFLSKIHVTRGNLAHSTLQCLEEWARQEGLIQEQPSANRGSAVNELLKSVDSELQSRLGSILTPFDFNRPLGDISRGLRSLKLDNSQKQKLFSQGIKPGFVSSDLPEALGRLAKLRKATNTAHGGSQISAATDADLEQTKGLVLKILRGIADPSVRQG